MELSGIILEIFEEKQVGDFKERIIRMRSDVKEQVLDVFSYNDLAFKTGFLKIGEKVVFSIILRGISDGEKQITQIVLKKPIKPTLELTQDHPFVDVDWIRKDSQIPK